jgi:hypothetical protein
MNFQKKSCEIINELECDILYQVTYNRKCEHCDYKDNKDRKFLNVLKCGHTMDIDNWRCPNCGQLNMTEIITNNNKK